MEREKKILAFGKGVKAPPSAEWYPFARFLDTFSVSRVVSSARFLDTFSGSLCFPQERIPKGDNLN